MAHRRMRREEQTDRDPRHRRKRHSDNLTSAQCHMLLANTPVDPRRKDAGSDGTPRHAKLLTDYAITWIYFWRAGGRERLLGCPLL